MDIKLSVSIACVRLFGQMNQALHMQITANPNSDMHTMCSSILGLPKISAKFVFLDVID
jgi:hypothetical protein